MTIDKLPSGSYRIRQQYKGKRYSITVPYKPTQKEALKLLSDEMYKAPNNTPQGSYQSVKDVINNFIDKREKDGLSPVTVLNYLSIVNNISDDFLSMRASDVTREDFQREVDRYSAKTAPKTVRNFYSLIKSALAEYGLNFGGLIKLPPMQKKAEYEPATRDIQRILDASVGTRYEIPYRLAVLGLRRGEIVAITAADLDDNNVLTVNKDLVLNKHRKYVIKNKPKTEESNRRILIPASLAEQIRAQGFAYNGDPHSINKYLHTFQDKLGIPRFRLHMFRHFCAAYLHKEGFTDQQILSYGGWSNSSDIMKRVYRYNLDPEESQKDISDSIGGFFS